MIIWRQIKVEHKLKLEEAIDYDRLWTWSSEIKFKVHGSAFALIHQIVHPALYTWEI